MKIVLSIASMSLVAMAAAYSLPASADVVVGYQSGADPTKVAINDGSYEKAIGEKIIWKRFNTGPEIVAALASGSINIAYVGSTPVASAISQGLPIKVFLVNTINDTNEELVERNGSGIDPANPNTLKGKKIATPFVSTSHYSLLNALKHWGLSSRDVKLINLTPVNIDAAWKRGDIDAAFTWDPALSDIKKTGKVVTSAGQVGKWGAPTLDLWITENAYASRHPEVLRKFVNATLKSFSDYYQHSDEWTVNSPQIAAIAKLTGASPVDIPAQLKGGQYPDRKEQASSALFGGGLAKVLKSTSQFLYDQKSIPRVKDSYAENVTTEYLSSDSK